MLLDGAFSPHYPPNRRSSLLIYLFVGASRWCCAGIVPQISHFSIFPIHKVIVLTADLMLFCLENARQSPGRRGMHFHGLTITPSPKPTVICTPVILKHLKFLANTQCQTVEENFPASGGGTWGERREKGNKHHCRLHLQKTNHPKYFF